MRGKKRLLKIPLNLIIYVLSATFDGRDVLLRPGGGKVVE